MTAGEGDQVCCCNVPFPPREIFMRSDGVSPRGGGTARPVCINSSGIGHGYFHLLCNHKITFSFFIHKVTSHDEDIRG